MYNQSSGDQFAYDDRTNDIVKTLVFELNKVRKANRRSRLYRSKLGDSVATTLHERGIKSTDQCYNDAVQQFGLMCTDSEFVTFEQKATGFQSQNLKDTFLKIFIEKVQSCSTWKSKLVTSNAYTHLSLTVRQSGISGDVFQVGVLLFKANVSIEKVFESCDNEGALITGKVLDAGLKPCMVVLNRDQGGTMCVIGPNKIYFDATNGDDYKIHIPEGYLRMNRHPVLGLSQPVVEIFCTLNSNRDCKLANNMDIYEIQNDIDQSMEPLQMIGNGVEVGIRAFFVPGEDFKGLSMKMQEALSPQTNLLENAAAGTSGTSATQNRRVPGRPPASLHNRLMGNTRSRQQTGATTTQASTANQPIIRKTKAQHLKEQAAAFKKAQPPIQVDQSVSFNGTGHFNTSQVSHQQRPSYSAFNGAAQNNNNNGYQFAQNNRSNQHQRNALNSTYAPTPISNFSPNVRRSNNALDQMQTAIGRVSLTPPRVSNAPQKPLNWNKPMAQVPQFEFKPTTSTMINTMGPQRTNNGFQNFKQQTSSQQPAYQGFKNPFVNNKTVPQFLPTQQQLSYQGGFQPFNNSSGATTTTTNKPFSFLNSGGNNQQAQGQPQQPSMWQQQPPQTTTFNSGVYWKPQGAQVKQVEMADGNGLAPFNPTPLPVRFTVNGTQSKCFDSKKSHQTTGLLPLQIQHELDQANLGFNQLCDSDQIFLRNCLKELTEFGGSVEEVQGAEMLMVNNPMQFFKMYQEAIAASKALEEAKSMESKPKADVEKENKPMITVQDFGEIHLFLINFAEKLVKSSKYIDKPKSTKSVLQAVSDPDNEMTALQGLFEIILEKPLPRNDSLVKLYGSKTVPPDMIFYLRDQQIKCHQFVFQQNDFMRDAMKKNQRMNMQNFHQMLTTITFAVPDWINQAAFENYIRFCYTTEFKMTQTGQSAMRKDRPHEALEIFRVACYFYSESLQECLVAREIIPNMNAYSAILFLNEIFHRETKSPCKRAPSERASTFLTDYCMFYLEKNLPVILRQDPTCLLSLPQTAVYELVKESLYYIVDARADIEVVLTYAAKNFADGDFFKLFQFVHQRMSKCCGFDQQHIPMMKQIAEADPKTVYSMEIIEGYNYSKLKHEKPKVRDSLALEGAEDEMQPASSTTGVKQSAADKSFSNLPNQGPSENVLIFTDGQADTQAITDPDFEMLIDLTEADTAVHLGQDKPGLSIVSEAFDVARRSWSLKVDIAKPSNEISLWLVERGSPCNEIDALQVLRRALPIKFTSMLFQMEIDDPGVKNRKSAIFFSFCHDQNQVIGHHNFANLDQLANKEKLKVRVKVREHVIYSAMIQYMTTTFQRRFKDECALEKTRKLCPRSFDESHGLFSQPSYVMYWLLSSDLLKVEDENTVLTFIFHYTSIVREKKGDVEAILAADLLVKALRFNYVDYYNLMSAIRKNPALQASAVMRDSIVKEQSERFKLKKKGIPKLLATFGPSQDEAKPISELHFCGGPRKYFNSQKVEGQGRNKLLNGSKDISLALTEELIQWAFHSKIQEISQAQQKLNPYQLSLQVSEQVQNRTRSLNDQLVEERIRTNRLQNELTQIKQSYEMEMKRRQMGNYQPTNYAEAPKHESPPRYVPQPTAPPLNQKENLPPKVSVAQASNQPAPLYNRPNQDPPAKRDPPGMLGGATQRRQPPMSLMNKSLTGGNNRTVQSEGLLLNNSFKKDNEFLTKPKVGGATTAGGGGAAQQHNNTLNLSAITNPNTKRQPPASLAGGATNANNLSMDLSAVMNKLNESPAPTLRRRPTKANNQFLASKDGQKSGENCTIF